MSSHVGKRPKPRRVLSMHQIKKTERDRDSFAGFGLELLDNRCRVEDGWQGVSRELIRV